VGLPHPLIRVLESFNFRRNNLTAQKTTHKGEKVKRFVIERMENFSEAVLSWVFTVGLNALGWKDGETSDEQINTRCVPDGLVCYDPGAVVKLGHY
jgi:hypothetical protein